MNACSKCGRRFPKSAKQRVMCLCEYQGEEINMNFPVSDVDIEKYKINEILSKEEQGRKAWLMLHQYVYQNAELAYQFYLVWKTKIPGFHQGCQCESEFAKIEEINPPDFSSKENFFEWGVKVHNLVNEKLGKPIMSLEEAKKVYNMV